MRSTDNVQESESKIKERSSARHATFIKGLRVGCCRAGPFFTGDLEPAVSRAGAISRLPPLPLPSPLVRAVIRRRLVGGG